MLFKTAVPWTVGPEPTNGSQPNYFWISEFTEQITLRALGIKQAATWWLVPVMGTRFKWLKVELWKFPFVNNSMTLESCESLEMEKSQVQHIPPPNSIVYLESASQDPILGVCLLFLQVENSLSESWRFYLSTWKMPPLWQLDESSPPIQLFPTLPNMAAQSPLYQSPLQWPW